MNIESFLNSEYVERIRIGEDRDTINGLRCNRNERVRIWDEEFVKSLLSDINNNDLTLYPDLSNLIEAISKYEFLDKDKILIGSGIDGIIKNIFETYTHQGMKIGVLNPTYAMYFVYSKLFKTDLKLIGYNISNFKIDRKSLFEALDEIKLLFIPNPNQPIEDNFDLQSMRELAKECFEKNILLVFDEAYYGFGCETAKPLIEEFDNVIVMRTFSKAFGMPSIRVGYMMANEQLTKRISQKRLSYETNSVGQKIAINLLKNIDYVEEYNKKVCESRDKIKKELSQINYKVNSHSSNFLLVKFESECMRDSVNKILLDRKIYTKANYRNDMSNCMLVTLGPFSDMMPFVEILKQNR